MPFYCLNLAFLSNFKAKSDQLINRYWNKTFDSVGPKLFGFLMVEISILEKAEI